MTESTQHIRSGRLAMILAAVSIASLFALFSVASAVAQDPVNAQYESAVTQANSNAGGPGSSQPAPSSSKPASGLQENVVSGLPFTGLDVVALFAVALALTSIGFALRRMTNTPPH